MTSVFFAIPAFDAKVGYDFCLSMYRTAEVFKDEGIGSEIAFIGSHAYLDLARDILVRQFLDSEASHLFQLDADLGWEAEDMVRMLRYNVDVVCGVYPVKQDEPKFYVNFNERRRPGLIGADGAPGGFTLIKRRVIETLYREYRELAVDHVKEVDGEMLCLHSPHILDRRYWSEDMGFCRRIREAGFDIWVDPTIALRHWNGSKCYDHRLIGNVVQARTA